MNIRELRARDDLGASMQMVNRASRRGKIPLGIDVLTAARNRIHWLFDSFPRIYVSFSGGKDSTVMLHLTMEEAARRERQIGVLFVDLEGQYKLTIDHIAECYRRYDRWVDPYWVAIPLNLRNAVSQFEPQWCCWEPGREQDWVRRPPPTAITDPARFPFYRYRMEFEEFVEDFGGWYGGGERTACLVGIRTDESLNRWRTICSANKQSLGGHRWTTRVADELYNAYPIYDWRTADLWTYHARSPDLPYNRLYDRMHQAGLTPHQMRICQPYGDDQRKGLWLFHVIEPETWGRVVARVNGANQGALYAQERGNILGVNKISKPEGHTWESYAKLLLASMPHRTMEQYQDRIDTFIHWWMARGVSPIPDEAPAEQEARREVPSWRRVCKALLRNDYWCKGLSFSVPGSPSVERYRQIMRKRRERWGA